MPDIMSIGLSGLNAAMAALNTTGHNIANVNTPQYSRQVVTQGATTPEHSGAGFFGTGVQVQSVQRLYSQFLQNQVFSAQTASSQLSTYSTQLDQVDSLLADQNSGLSGAMQDFFGSVQNLADNPSSVPVRQAMLDSSGNMVDRFNSLASQLATTGSDINQQVTSSIANINTLATNIADLNQQITNISGANPNQVPNDLLDQRDQLVQELNKEVKVTVFKGGDGSYNLFIGTGQALVSGDTALKLVAQPYTNDQQDLGVAYQVGNTTVPLSDATMQGGNLGALLSFRSQVLQPTVNALGSLAIEISRQFNNQNKMGVGLDGLPGDNLFAPVGAINVAATTNTAGATLTADVPDTAGYPSDSYMLAAGATPGAYTLTDTATGTTKDVTFSFVKIPGVGATFPLSPPMAPGSSKFTISTASGSTVTITNPVNPVSSVDEVQNMINQYTPTTGVSAKVVNGQLELDSELHQTVTLGDPSGQLAGLGLAAGTYTAGTGIADVALPNDQALRLTLTTDLKPGDSFNLTPADPGTAAASMAMAISDPNKIAAAAPIATAAGSTNLGTGQISAGAVTSGLPLDANLQQPVTVTFTDATHYTVSGNGVPGGYATPQPYDPSQGVTLNINGWSASITGQPSGGDTFSVGQATRNAQDNRNALAMSAIDNARTMIGGTATIQDAYGQLVSRVGDQAHQADNASKAQDNLLKQATQYQQSYSGVNLDEEAANLMKYQQAYQAAGKVMQMASGLFSTVLGVVDKA